jgi:tRNA-splicing ligase RtcB
MSRKPDHLEAEARKLAIEAGVDPDSRVAKPGSERGMPAWVTFRDAARAAQNAREQAQAAADIANLRPQEPQYQNSPLLVIGDHEESTIGQMKNCMSVGNVVAGVLCADGHLGYSQPVGGVIAYEKQISISGVGWDIGCGNQAIRLDTPYAAIADTLPLILSDVCKTISFGVGRSNAERVEHELFDDADAWREADVGEYRQKALAQLGTVGSGNHYVDILRDEEGFTWIGVHFGSRGFGHTSAKRYVAAAGGKDGIHVTPTIVDEDSEVGRRYIAAMRLAGRYAYAGRAWVVERVRQIIGGNVTDNVANHHNFAFKETHVIDGVARDLWVVRKGATPAFPGQRGFVGGSMGDDAVILEGVDSEKSKASLYSTIHGAGRTFGRKEAKRRFTRAQMDAWLKDRGVLLAGADLDESPQAYRRLPDVLAHHADTVKVLHRLRPMAVAMAGAGIEDPWRD